MAPSFPDELRQFVATATWTFARTYAATWPHEYIVRTPENAHLMLAMAHHIFEHGVEARFYSKMFKYHHEGGKVYWCMDGTPEAADLINRCDENPTYEARLAAGTLPGAAGSSAGRRCLTDRRLGPPRAGRPAAVSEGGDWPRNVEFATVSAMFHFPMKTDRRAFLHSTATASLGLALARGTGTTAAAQPDATARVRLIRHATCLLHYGGRRLLLDPMLNDQGVQPPIARTPNPRPNPLVALPVPAAQVLEGVEGVLVTHTHSDHWDAAATKLVRKDAPLLIQPPDAAKFADWGFTAALPVADTVTWQGIRVTRTGGQHGRGAVAERLAPVSGFVLSASGQPTLYIAGDTVWCPEVAAAISTHQPDIVIVNAGAAQFLEGGVITMDVDDVVQVCRAAPKARVIAVHMEAINHCVLTRSALRTGLTQAGVTKAVLIPADGEELRLG